MLSLPRDSVTECGERKGDVCSLSLPESEALEGGRRLRFPDAHSRALCRVDPL